MSLFVRFGCVLGVGMVVALSACTIGSPTYVTASEAEPDDEDTATKPKAGTTNPPGEAGSTTCDAPLVKVDLSKLTACEGGKGHCYAKDKVGPMASRLIACAKADEVCVPDEVLEAGGGTLKACKTIGGTLPGACLTAALVPEILQQGGSALPQDVCDADQKCIPCKDPRPNGGDTGMCGPIGVSDKACSNPGGATGDAGASAATPAVPCCKTGFVTSGTCIDQSLVPEGQRDKTKQDVCPANNKCVPRAFVEQKPVTCDSGFLGRGVCLDKCFDSMMAFASQLGVLSRSTCAITEACIPCTFGKDMGMPGCT